MMTRQCDCVTERRFRLCVPGSGTQSSGTLLPQQLSGECNPGEQSQQQWRGTRYGEVRPLALRLHSEVSANLLECNFNPPAQREPFDDPDRRDRRISA